MTVFANISDIAAKELSQLGIYSKIWGRIRDLWHLFISYIGVVDIHANSPLPKSREYSRARESRKSKIVRNNRILFLPISLFIQEFLRTETNYRNKGDSPGSKLSYPIRGQIIAWEPPNKGSSSRTSESKGSAPES